MGKVPKPYAAAKTSKAAKKARGKPIKNGRNDSSGAVQSVGKLSGLGAIHCVGGNVTRNWHQRWDLKDGIANAIHEARQKGENLYLYLTTESLDKVTHENLIKRDGDENVPVLIAVSSHVPPTELAARFSLQLQNDDMFPLADIGLHWEESSLPGVYFLKSKRSGGEWEETEFLQLALLRPSQILDASPEKVETVSIKYKGDDIVISDPRNIDGEVDEMIEDGDVDVCDKSEVIALLKEQKFQDEQGERDKLEKKKACFRAMVDNMSKATTDVLGKLEDMRIFKIYPKNVPPTKSWMGVETGFRKGAMVNRYIGNADDVY